MEIGWKRMLAMAYKLSFTIYIDVDFQKHDLIIAFTYLVTAYIHNIMIQSIHLMYHSFSYAYKNSTKSQNTSLL